MVNDLRKSASKQNMVSLKIYFDRARMYLQYINFFMLNLVLINSMDGTLGQYVTEYKWFVVPVLVVFYVLLLLFIGYLDTLFGVRQEEARNNALHNPVLMNMVESIEEIKEKVTALETNGSRTS